MMSGAVTFDIAAFHETLRQGSNIVGSVEVDIAAGRARVFLESSVQARQEVAVFNVSGDMRSLNVRSIVFTMSYNNVFFVFGFNILRTDTSRRPNTFVTLYNFVFREISRKRYAGEYSVEFFAINPIPFSVRLEFSL